LKQNVQHGSSYLFNIKKVKKSLSNIKENGLFELFNINYSNDDKEIIDNLLITGSKTFSFFGYVNEFINNTDLFDYIKEITNLDDEHAEKFKQLFFNIAENMSDVYEENYIWFISYKLTKLIFRNISKKIFF
jgi:hypothetical protein